MATLIVGNKEYDVSGRGRIQIGTGDEVVNLKIGDNVLMPKEYELSQNYPNPFNPVTNIQYQVPSKSRVSLKVYNILGEIVATLRDNIEEPGSKQVPWDATSFASGIYFYRLEATGLAHSGKPFTSVKKMVLMK